MDAYHVIGGVLSISQKAIANPEPKPLKLEVRKSNLSSQPEFPG